MIQEELNRKAELWEMAHPGCDIDIAYIEGYAACKESDEYRKLQKNAAAWELLVGRLNDWSEKKDGSPCTDEEVAEIFWEINNGRMEIEKNKDKFTEEDWEG